ncbi:MULTISPECIES: PAQR family membrane homeostasis protein TrhA [unclassified Jeotgalibaca]|uniref:PAQR family membrane homeostasis protein TrhA n=1 Tax=unclassified Jeotgalibaca TaxID=2621505 RepID=UPI003FCF61CA
MSNQTLEIKKSDLVMEVLNAITHGIGTLLSIVALVFLVAKGIQSGDGIHLTAYLVYGISMILLFLASTLYHSFSFTRFKNIFHYIDHAAIYLLIAGSYTPFCLIALEGTQAKVLFISVWGIALVGVVLKVFFVGKYNKLSTILYLMMGWLAIFLIKPISAYLGTSGLTLMILGGLAYSLGTIFYSIKRFKFMHVIWHLFVLAGAAFHYFTVLLYV